MAKAGTFEHPKTKRLARHLGVPSWCALGLLEAFWHWVGRYAPTGEIDLQALEDCADTLRFDQGGEYLKDCLEKSGWLDPLEGGSFYVHDWHEHATEGVKKDLTRSGKVFANGASVRRYKVGGTDLEGENEPGDSSSQTVATTSRQNRDKITTPQPNPTQPNPAQPRNAKTKFSHKDGWELITRSISIEDTPSLYDAWESYGNHRSAMKLQPYTEIGLKSLLSRVDKIAKENQVDGGRLLTASILTTLERNWKGIVPDQLQAIAASLPKVKPEEGREWWKGVKVR